MTSEMSSEEGTFVVFEGAACSGTITPDTRHLLHGIQPVGHGDWDIEVTATPQKDPTSDGAPQGCEGSVACEDFESLLLDLMHCDYKYICKSGEHSPEDTPCACFPDKYVPQNVWVNSEWDGNSGEVSWDSDGFSFVIEYSTS